MKQILIISILWVSLSYLLGCNNSKNKTSFDSRIWQQNNNYDILNPRGKMVKDLENNHFKKEMNKSQLLDLLGIPAERGLIKEDSAWYYPIGVHTEYAMDPESFIIQFDNIQKIKNYYVVQH